MRRYLGSIIVLLFMSCQSTPPPPETQDQPQVEYFGKNFKLPDTVHYNKGYHYNNISEEEQHFVDMNLRIVFTDSTVIVDEGVYAKTYKGRWGSNWVFYSKNAVIYRRDDLVIRRNNSRFKYWN